MCTYKHKYIHILTQFTFVIVTIHFELLATRTATNDGGSKRIMCNCQVSGRKRPAALAFPGLRRTYKKFLNTTVAASCSAGVAVLFIRFIVLCTQFSVILFYFYFTLFLWDFVQLLWVTWYFASFTSVYLLTFLYKIKAQSMIPISWQTDMLLCVRFKTWLHCAHCQQVSRRSVLGFRALAKMSWNKLRQNVSWFSFA